jgi:hypothetical protein
MFGYVRAYTPELKMREYEYYRAAYCGLCRANGRATGCMSRFSLSYDFVFLALVRIALTGITPKFRYRRCAAHPAKKRNEMLPNDALLFCVRAGALLTYHKLRDDLNDETGRRRMLARAGLVFARKMRRRASAALPGLDGKIKAALDRLAGLEAKETASVDLPAGVFGEITADILSFGLEGKEAAIARQIGLHVGKWIYIADALDDYQSDAARGRYNPFLKLWADTIPPESKEGIRTALTHELMEAEKGFDLLDYGNNDTLHGVILNIIYCGMPRRIDDIICGRKREVGKVSDERSI